MCMSVFLYHLTVSFPGLSNAKIKEGSLTDGPQIRKVLKGDHLFSLLLPNEAA